MTGDVIIARKPLLRSIIEGSQYLGSLFQTLFSDKTETSIDLMQGAKNIAAKGLNEVKHLSQIGPSEALNADTSNLTSRPTTEQFAALCYRRDPETGAIEVLLVTTRDTGRWIIPKGWPMKRKKPHKAAAIEAWEEAGVTGIASKNAVGHFHYLKGMEDGSDVPCSVSVFLLKADNIEDDYPEKEQRKREWVSCADAADRVLEGELKVLLLSLPEILDRAA